MEGRLSALGHHRLAVLDRSLRPETFGLHVSCLPQSHFFLDLLSKEDVKGYLSTTGSRPGSEGAVFSEPGGIGIIQVSVRLPRRSLIRKRNQ